MSERIVFAIRECSEGNETVGTTWLEVAAFSETATLKDVCVWAESVHRSKGKLIIKRESS